MSFSTVFSYAVIFILNAAIMTISDSSTTGIIISALVTVVAAAVLWRLHWIVSSHTDVLYYGMAIVAVVVTFAVELPNRQKLALEAEYGRLYNEFSEKLSNIEAYKKRRDTIEAQRILIKAASEGDSAAFLESFGEAVSRLNETRRTDASSERQDADAAYLLRACGPPPIAGGLRGAPPSITPYKPPLMSDEVLKLQYDDCVKALNFVESPSASDAPPFPQSFASVDEIRAFLASDITVQFIVYLDGKAISSDTLREFYFPTGMVQKRLEEFVAQSRETELKLCELGKELSLPGISEVAACMEQQGDGSGGDSQGHGADSGEIAAFPQPVLVTADGGALGTFKLFWLPIFLLSAIGLKLGRRQ